MVPANILLILEWVSFIIGLFSVKKLSRNGQLVICFLALVVLTETISYFVRIHIPPSQQTRFTSTFYNYMIPAQGVCLLLFYYKKTTYNYWRLSIKGFIAIIVFITVLQSFAGTANEFNTFNYTLVAVFISACSLHYLFELMNLDEIEHVGRDPFMYLSIGLLLHYLGTLPFHSMRTYLYNVHQDIFYIYYYLFFAFNYFLYGIITFGFLWAKKK